MKALINVIKDIETEFGVYASLTLPSDFVGNVYPELEFNDGVEIQAGVYGVVPAPITQAQFDTRMLAAKAAIDANQYQRDRAIAYPSLQDQADMQFHDLANGTTTWQDAIQAVKDAYPKPV